jgi:DNA-binding phage protein
MPKSLPYQDFLIERLKDPEYAALYLETHIELEDGEEPEPELIQLALTNVAEALAAQHMTPEQAITHIQKLEVILSYPANFGIYELGKWLNALGLKLTVTVAEKSEDSNTNTIAEPEVTV